MRKLMDSRYERQNYLTLFGATSMLSETNGVAFTPAPFIAATGTGEDDAKFFLFPFIWVKTERFVGDLHSGAAPGVLANDPRHVNVMSACPVQGTHDANPYRTGWPAIDFAERNVAVNAGKAGIRF
jgi:hypothetical protein